MDLKRVKTVMIIILVAINAFFVYNILSYYHGENYIDDVTIDNAIEILARDGIRIDRDTLPNKKIKTPIYESRFYESYNENVVKLLTGSGVEKTYSLPDGIRFVANNGDTVEFFGQFGVSYMSSTANKYLAFSNIILNAAKADAASVSQSVISSIREKLSYDTSATVGYAKIATECDSVYYDSISGYYVVKFSQTMDGMPIYGHEMFCVIENENLLYMEGDWSFLTTDEKYSSQPVDQINILFMEKERVCGELESENDDSEENDAAVYFEIEKIDNVFCTYLKEDKSGLYYIPAWRITYEGGTEVVYDAQSASIYVKGK